MKKFWNRDHVGLSNYLFLCNFWVKFSCLWVASSMWLMESHLFLLSFTSSPGIYWWKKTSSVCVCVCVHTHTRAHICVCVCTMERVMIPWLWYSLRVTAVAAKVLICVLSKPLRRKNHSGSWSFEMLVRLQNAMTLIVSIPFLINRL